MTGAGVAICVYLHAEPERLRATLAALREHTPADARLFLLPDGPDQQTRLALTEIDLPQLGTDHPRGTPASSTASRRRPTRRCCPARERLAGGTGLAGSSAGRHRRRSHRRARGPSTNLSWNEQAAFPRGGSSPAAIARTAARAGQQLTGAARTLAPLHSLADFCYLVRREVIAAVGEADEDYALGPCWEMDYNIRAARAGFAGVWVGAAYVHRLPPTTRRRREEARRFEANRRRYQDRFAAIACARSATAMSRTALVTPAMSSRPPR